MCLIGTLRTVFAENSSQPYLDFLENVMCLLFLLVEQMMHFSNWFHLDYIITRFKSNPCMARFSKAVAAPQHSLYVGSVVGSF